jgi:hypothetical protein
MGSRAEPHIGRLAGKNAIVTGAAGYVFIMLPFCLSLYEPEQVTHQ